MSAAAMPPAMSERAAGLARRNLPLLAFVWISLLVAMSVSQEENIEPGSLSYWLLIAPAALMPLLDIGPLLRVLTGRGRVLALFLLLAGVWHLARGDARAVLQLGLLIWVLAWISTQRAVFRVQDLLALFLVLIGVGIAVYTLTDLNKWGLVPGATDTDYGIWRISFFPNIANSGALALVVFVLLTHDRSSLLRHRVVFAVALYFMIFSFVRAVLIAAVLYLALNWYFSLPGRARPARLFWVSLLVAVGANVAIAVSPLVVNQMQQLPLVGRLLLRGEIELSAAEIYEQLYRPWLWWQHLQQFALSPSLMGLGDFEFNATKIEALVEGLEEGDSVSLPTRLLAAYGLPGLLFPAFLLLCLRARARAGDGWSCACFPAVFLLCMNWGSIFHPTSAFFVLFLMMVVRGSQGFDFGAHGIRRAHHPRLQDAAA